MDGETTLRERVGALEESVKQLEEGNDNLQQINAALKHSIVELETSKKREVGEIEEKLQMIVENYELRLKEQNLFALQKETILTEERDKLQEELA